MPRLRESGCEGDAACAAICPAHAIDVTNLPSGSWSWTLDRARCIGCGRCIEVCPNQALEAESIFELATRSREELKVTHTVHHSLDQSEAAADQRRGELGTKVRDRARGLFGRSLQLRHLDVGSCNGCDWELN